MEMTKSSALDLDMRLQRGYDFEYHGLHQPDSKSGSESDNQVTMERESTDIFEDYDLYLTAKNGKQNDFSSILDRVSATNHVSSGEILSRVTPIGNTFFHVAAVHGNYGIVNYIATKDPSIILQKNFNGDTALHLAAKAGNESMVETLVLIHHDLLGSDVPESQEETKDEADNNNLLRAKNKRGNTALHEALINGRESIVQYLIKEDPELLYQRNKQGIYGLYLAAEAGFANCVSSILQYSTDQERLNDLLKEKSPVEAAIVNKKLGYVEVVLYLLKGNASCATRRDKSGSLPIHLAAVKGHVATVCLLLNYCPADPVELLDKYGRNILHLAAENGKLNVVKYILHNPELNGLINMSDKYGNKPLHLAAINWHPEIVNALTWDKRVDITSSNDKGVTALDAADFHMSDNPPFRQRLTWSALKAAGTPRRQSKFKRGGSSYWTEKYKDRVNTLLLVSTLVATITFAAGFTLPGGYSISETNIGMAAMLRKKAFHVFIFCDTIAMYSSIVVAVSLIWAQLGDLRLVLDAVTVALPLLVIALTMMSVAFTAGIFLVVRNLHWLRTVVLVTGFVFLSVLLVLLIPLCMPFTSSNRIARYISYYPFCLLMLATRTNSRDKKDG
ncbi:protein ACCELERATED CELL DEATH 6-like isoform X2 [Primulina huaijiensis]|uniref:protein ACCELERATED CELL DEATH 6-like isoform X2 n=1 Tax=Primulina huaijiensis TaxID=1492673 RepID=UPI003CC7916A